MLRDKATELGTSFLVHGALFGVFGYLAYHQIKEPPKDEPIEFEFIAAAVPAEPALPEPPAEVTPPEPQPIIAEKRPPEVPDTAKVVKVDKPAPFSPDAVDDTGNRDAPGDVEAITAPVTTRVFDMATDVGGGGGSGSGDYVTTTNGTIGVGAPGSGGSGTGGGRLGGVDRAGTSDVKVARDWQVTTQPEPLNDRDFEPDFPPVAKREGREAAVVVRLFIDAGGAVARAEVVSGPRGHGFRKAALAYARKLRFAPARAGENPVASRIEWTVHFYVRN